MEQIAGILNGVLYVMGGFMGWQGVYNLLSAKTEHKPDQGTDAWWLIGLGAFCIATASSNVVGKAFDQLNFTAFIPMLITLIQ